MTSSFMWIITWVWLLSLDCLFEFRFGLLRFVSSWDAMYISITVWDRKYVNVQAKALLEGNLFSIPIRLRYLYEHVVSITNWWCIGTKRSLWYWKSDYIVDEFEFLRKFKTSNEVMRILRQPFKSWKDLVPRDVLGSPSPKGK